MDSGLGFVQPMFFVGVVEDRNDPRAEGRVRVRAFGVHGSNQDIATEDLPWATLIIGNHDVNFTPPPLNAWVFGFFIDGRDAQQPMILGLIPAQASELVDPATKGWGSVPAENYDRESQGSRPRDLGLSPMSRLATGEFLNETYNEALETNRVRNIPIAGGCAFGHNAVGNGNAWSNDIGETGDGPAVIGSASRGLTPERQEQLLAFAAKNNINPNALVGVLSIESNINPNARGGASNRFYGIFQLEDRQIPNLTQRTFGRSLSPSEYRNLSFDDQLLVYQQYINQWVPNPSSFFTGDANQDASRLWALQLAPGRARNINYNDPSATISATRQSASISAGPSLVTVGSVRSGTLERGGLLDTPSQPTGPQLLEDPSQPDRVQQAQLDEQRFSRADEIRTQISAIDARLEELGSRPQAEEARSQLLAEREQLEAELAALEGSGETEGTAGEPYSGYANPSNAPGCVSSWEEPPSGYSARYPYNRVIETASGHSIELDDTPGGERIMIWHRDGSYVQITSTSTTHKNMSDAYHVNERNNHVYIGGNNIVTIEGDSYVLVKGDKVEEIEGNYKQIVHGNVQIGGGGRVEINGADRTDIRSAALGLDSNVENLNIRTSKNIVFESGETFNVKSKNVRMGASENMSITGQKGLFLQSQGGDVHVKSDGSVFLNPDQNLFLRTEGGTISAEAQGSIRFNSSGSFISINSSSYMSLGSKAEMLIGSQGSLNLNAAENLGIIAADLFLEGKGDVNLNAGTNFNAKSSQLNMAASTAYIESGGVLDLKGGHVKVGGGSKVSIDANIVAIDDIIQMANGNADEPQGVQANADKKEPLDPSRFGDGTGEFGGDAAAQAQSAELPASAQSVAVGPASPPDRPAPNPRKQFSLDNVISVSSSIEV